MKTPHAIALETVNRIADIRALHLTGGHAVAIAEAAINADRAQRATQKENTK